MPSVDTRNSRQNWRSSPISSRPTCRAGSESMTSVQALRRPISLGTGLYTNPGEEVQPGFLTILDPTPATIVPPPDGRSTGRRSALAKWLTDSANPLVARVMVNRIWHYHFGRGIVATPSDLGMMGERPYAP